MQSPHLRRQVLLLRICRRQACDIHLRRHDLVNGLNGGKVGIGGIDCCSDPKSISGELLAATIDAVSTREVVWLSLAIGHSQYGNSGWAGIRIAERTGVQSAYFHFADSRDRSSRCKSRITSTRSDARTEAARTQLNIGIIDMLAHA